MAERRATRNARMDSTGPGLAVGRALGFAVEGRSGGGFRVDGVGLARGGGAAGGWAGRPRPPRSLPSQVAASPAPQRRSLRRPTRRPRPWGASRSTGGDSRRRWSRSWRCRGSDRWCRPRRRRDLAVGCRHRRWTSVDGFCHGGGPSLRSWFGVGTHPPDGGQDGVGAWLDEAPISHTARPVGAPTARTHPTRRQFT